MRHREFDQDAQKAFLGIFAKESRSFESLQEHDGSVVSGRQILHSRPLVKVTGDSFAHLLRGFLRRRQVAVVDPPVDTLPSPSSPALPPPKKLVVPDCSLGGGGPPGNGGCGGGGAPGNGGCNPETRIVVPAVAARSLLPGHYRHWKLRQDSDCDEVALPPIGVGGASLGILEKSSYTFKATAAHQGRAARSRRTQSLQL